MRKDPASVIASMYLLGYIGSALLLVMQALFAALLLFAAPYLLVVLSAFLIQHNKYRAAENVCKCACWLAQLFDPMCLQLGIRNEALILGLKNQAVAAVSQGRFSEAEHIARHVLAIVETFNDRDYLSVGDALSEIGFYCLQQGKVEKANELATRAVSLLERTLAHSRDEEFEHESCRNMLVNALFVLAEVHEAKRMFFESEPVRKRAVELVSDCSEGLDTLAAATHMTMLGNLYTKMGRYKDAETLLAKGLKIRRRDLSNDDILVASSMRFLAASYLGQERIDEADPLLQRALNIVRRRCGKYGHPELPDYLSELAVLKTKKGRFNEAEMLFYEALRLKEAFFGKDHPDLAGILENYALLMREMNDEVQAAELEQRAKSLLDTPLAAR